MTDAESELEIAQPEDFFVQRDADDNLQPVTQELPGVEEKIRVIPMSIGDLNKYNTSGGQLNPAELTNEDLAEILNNHWYDVRHNDDFEITAEMLETDMIGFGKDALITAILRASGYDLQQSLNMENIEMLDKVPEGKLGMMMDLAEKRS